tara:strand:- start:29 stop:247 length:219 start_codon:yes stop_codon:yes gene_type:complete
MVKHKLKTENIIPRKKTGLAILNLDIPELSKIISSLSFFILINVKKIDRQKIIGKIKGIIAGRDKKINLTKK